MNSANDIRNKNVSLSDLCVYFDAENSRDEETGLVDKFVGLRFIDGKLSVHFPVGYAKPENADDRQIRLDILNLISVLSSFGTPESLLHQSDFDYFEYINNNNLIFQKYDSFGERTISGYDDLSDLPNPVEPTYQHDQYDNIIF